MMRIDSKTSVLVYGLGKSGSSAVNYFMKCRANVTITDDKPFYDLRFILEPYLEGGAHFKHPGEIGFSVCDFDLVLLSPGVSVDKPFLQMARACKIPVMSDVELAFEQIKAFWTAVTGTNGKTTTTSLIGDIFQKYFSRVIVAGNIGDPICDYIQHVSPSQHVVVEVSSYQLEHIFKFRPQVAIVLNVSNDHLERHKSMEGYIHSKQRIFENQQEDDILILNYDDQVVRHFAMSAHSRVLFYTTNTVVQEGAFVKNKAIVVRMNGTIQEICSLNDITLRGKHNLGNVMAAILAAVVWKVPVDQIRLMIKSFQPLSHRMEYVGKYKNVRVYNDSKATNMDALARALESFDNSIVLIAGGEDKGGPMDEVVGLISEKVKRVVLFGKDVSRFQTAIRDVPVESFPSLREAVTYALSKTAPHDVLLFSPGGSSFDLYSNFEERGNDFKKIIEELSGKLKV